ncbi:synaptic vesicle glycoprotein 2C [Tribolium castaneum]|uniref:synaptic vesicle glycoprotein 2C n=1 Tax=Tribolium castaneum TaxID=7070 RepID=UPI0030FE70AF
MKETEDNNVFVLSKRLDDAEKNKNSDECRKPADFETAIGATGFGKFNIILLLIAMPAGWSSIFETTTMSYVFPAAQCDLSLTLENKGFLNAITYIGMISSAFVWGYLCDTLGRKKLLAIGLFLDGIFVLMSASSQNATILMIAKFLGGFIINGPFAALTTYLSEFHCARHRARIQMMLGIVFSLGTVILPFVAWAVLPLNLSVKIFNDSVEFHSWNLYLCLCAFPALISSIAFIFMPESPKFLMSMGRNEKALEVFRKVYCFNTGNAPETFPIKELVEETKLNNDSKHGGRITANRTKLQAMKEGWQQITPLFFPPHLGKIILVCLLQMLTMMSLNTLRLWLPQIFQAINDYQYYHNGSTTDLCTMIDQIRPKNQSQNCEVNLNNSSVYINSIIVAVVSIGGYIIAGMLINALGKKRLLNILGILSGSGAMCLYFAQNSLSTIILSCLFVSLGSININVVLAVVVDLFPTTLRTMTISLTMMVGRSGAMLGNLIFPVLLQLGCAPPFFTVGAAIVEKSADFETAISETGFGLFNLILISVATPSVLSSQLETSSLSFVFPVARCDLDISLEARGVVNATIYTGMITSCFMWGSLVDVFGRRKVLVFTHFVDAFFVLMTTFAPNLYVLMASKFLGGFIVNGISMALTPYLSEFHGTLYRARVPLTIGLIYSVANVGLPLLAWSILPLNINFGLFGGFEFHAWNLFLLVTMFPTVIAGVAFFLMPESPKYLMSKGNNEDALKVFEKIFAMNKKQPKEEYPVKSLVDDKQIYQKKYSVKEAWQQISPLFSLKYAGSLTLVCLLQFFYMMSINSLRLWLPEIFQIVNDYEQENDKPISFCQMLNRIKPTVNAETDTCSMNFDNSSVYINSVYVALCAITGYVIVALFVNKLGKKKILISLGLIGAITVASIYFAPNSSTALGLICVHLMSTGISVDTVIAATVDLFPTSLRGSAISLSFMFGRIGSVLGNLIFPVLIQAGCAATFFTLGSFVMGCTVLSVFIPNTERKALG